MSLSLLTMTPTPTKNNPGLTKAREAAVAVGARLAVPDFGQERPEGATDFNDLAVSMGLDKVRACIEAAQSVEVDPPSHDDVDDGQADGGEQAKAEDDADAIARLCRLSAMDYDRIRRTEARRLGVQVSTLDKLVREARAQHAAQDDAPFAEVEPWPEPVDGASLLSDMAQTVKRYVVLDNNSAAAVTLWCACTWLADVVDTCPLQTQQELRSHAGRVFDASGFRLQWLSHLDGRHEDYRTGYADAMCAYIQVTLEGGSVNVETRDVLGYLRECGTHCLDLTDTLSITVSTCCERKRLR